MPSCQYCTDPVAGPRWSICGSAACKRARNTDQKRRARSVWTEEQRLSARACEKDWRDRNPERVRANNRAAYLANPEKYAQQRDAWREKNRPRHLQLSLLHQSKRRVAKFGGESRRVTDEEWERIVRRAEGRCVYCKQAEKLTMDHVIPLARGGRHAIGNLAPACDRCNKSKGKLFVMEWRCRQRALEA